MQTGENRSKNSAQENICLDAVVDDLITLPKSRLQLRFSDIIVYYYHMKGMRMGSISELLKTSQSSISKSLQKTSAIIGSKQKNSEFTGNCEAVLRMLYAYHDLVVKGESRGMQ